MKNILILSLLCVLACTGCSSNYTIRFSNGTIVTAKGKPKYNGERQLWVYTDALTGQQMTVSRMRVAEIAPASGKSSQFIPQSGQ